jgi:hypothetical protein
MKRVIVDFNKLTNEILDLLVAKYPNGYNAIDIITFHDKNKNRIDAIEVRDDDAIYLVKVSNKLVNSMEGHESSIIPDLPIEEVSEKELFPDEELPDKTGFDEVI